MVVGFLLHDASDVGVGGVSGERKFGIWGRVLKWYRRHQEAFGLLEGLLNGGGPLQCFSPPPAGDPSKASKPEHNLVRSGGKSLPCRENIAVA